MVEKIYYDRETKIRKNDHDSEKLIWYRNLTMIEKITMIEKCLMVEKMFVVVEKIYYNRENLLW